MRTYTTGDVSEPLDLIARNMIGSEADVTTLLDMNPGLAGQGLMLAARQTILLPERSAVAVIQPRRLFG